MPYPELVTLIRNALLTINRKTQALEAKWVAEATVQTHRSDMPHLVISQPVRKVIHPRSIPDKPMQEKRKPLVMADGRAESRTPLRHADLSTFQLATKERNRAKCATPKLHSSVGFPISSPSLSSTSDATRPASPPLTGRLLLKKPAFGIRVKQSAAPLSTPAPIAPLSKPIASSPQTASSAAPLMFPANVPIPQLFFPDAPVKAKSPPPRPIPQPFFVASTPTPPRATVTVNTSISSLSPSLANGRDVKNMLFRNKQDFVVLPKKVQHR